jgi:soluble lytic murein transglycosylase
MPRVPVLTQQTVQPQAVPSPFLRVQASPADFGGQQGEAAAQAGARLERASERLMTRAAEMQKEDDALKVEAAYARFSDLERTFMHDPEKGVYARKGGNAVSAYDDTMKWWDDTSKEAVSGLGSQNQQRLMQQMLARRRDAALDGVARHVARERTVAMGETWKARLDGLVQDAAAAYNDPAKVDQLVGEAEGGTAFWGARQGQSAEVIEASRRAARSAIRSSVVERMALTDPLGAKSYFDKHREEIDGLTQAKLDRALQAAVQGRVARDAVNAVMPKPGDPVAAGDVRDRVWQLEGGEARNPFPGQTARGGGITDQTWRNYAGRLGLSEEQRGSREAYDKIWAAYQQEAATRIGRALSPSEQYAAWFLGIEGARAFLSADRGADAREVYGRVAGENIAEQAFRVNGRMMQPGMTVGQVLDQVSAKVGSGSAAPSDASVRGSLIQRQAELRQRLAGQPPEVIERAEAMLVAEFGQRRQGEEDQRLAALRGIREHVYGRKSLDGLTPQQIAVLETEPLERDRLEHWVERQGKVQTDQLVYAELRRLDPDEFEKVDLTDPRYRASLSESDWKRMVDLQVAVRTQEGRADRLAAKAGERSRQQVVDQALREAGIDPTPKDTDKTGAAKVAGFHRALDGKIEEWKAANPSKRPTGADYQRMADELLIKGTLKGSGWVFDDERRVFDLRDQKERDTFRVDGTLSNAVDRARLSRVTGVPPDLLKPLVERMRKDGIEATPENIARAFAIAKEEAAQRAGGQR